MLMATNINVATVPTRVHVPVRKPIRIRMLLYGVQRNKANQNKFFIGYRKHSIVCPSPKGPIVLFSNDTADGKVMLALIELMDRIEGLEVEYLVAVLRSKRTCYNSANKWN